MSPVAVIAVLLTVEPFLVLLRVGGLPRTTRAAGAPSWPAKNSAWALRRSIASRKIKIGVGAQGPIFFQAKKS